MSDCIRALSGIKKDGGIIIESFRYNTISKDKDRELKALIETAWSNHGEMRIHPKEMDAMSFCAIIDGAIVGYMGVVSWSLFVKNESYMMCGFCCVCTHPAHRHCGIGGQLVKEANHWIESIGTFDIGLFTCSAALVEFYRCDGKWQPDSSLVLIESNRDGAYRSDQLEVEVLKYLISDKAKRSPSHFTGREIILNFPHGQFI